MQAFSCSELMVHHAHSDVKERRLLVLSGAILNAR
jgi:hypothetical protein